MITTLPSTISYSSPIWETKHQKRPLHSSFSAVFKGKKITTRLPRDVAFIRSVSARVFTGLLFLAFTGSVLCWPLTLAGGVFSLWMIHQNFWGEDPLIKKFKQVVGGSDAYLQLPVLELKHGKRERVYQAIERISWDSLPAGICRAKSLDHRRIIFLKAESQDDQQTREIVAFVERVGPKDLPRKNNQRTRLLQSFIHAIGTPFKGNTFKTKLSPNGLNQEHTIYILPTLSKELSRDLKMQCVIQDGDLQ